MIEPASRKAAISAWAVGSESMILRFQPRAMIVSALTTTAPTGTSFISKARCAQRRASSMKISSERGDLSSVVVRGSFAIPVSTDILRNGGLNSFENLQGNEFDEASDYAYYVADDLRYDCMDHGGDDNADDWVRNHQRRDDQ